METCPNCGFSLAESSVDCPRCGIILEKFRAREEGAPASTPPPSAPPATGDQSGMYSGAESLSPSAAVYGAGATAITGPTLESLTSVRPWINFIGGYLLVISALMVIGAIAMTVLDPGKGELGVFAFVYLIEAALVLVLAFPLKRSGKALEGLSATNATRAVEEFVDAQASFWRRAGWMTLIGLILAVVGILAAIGLGVALS